ncbi:hypothetical protein HPP92_003289 [Vanilla planifolia]|uniref:Pectinesterase inhibitor domain-containing protein n=1 Tax=Vanilla planifolia TaxID=51239 RepID=A0A835RXD3_VANPL|nr:hypothetical protein HPP92_003289 [Vanilla planifolia]
MKPKPEHIHLLLLLLLVASVAAAETNLESSCKKVASLIPATAGERYNFCITSFQVVHGSQFADGLGLDLIAAGLTKTAYNHNRILSEELLKGTELSEAERTAIRSCAVGYAAGGLYLDRGNTWIESGEGGLNSALFSFQEAWLRAEECVENLRDAYSGDDTSLMAKENSLALGLIDIVLKLTLLLKV